MKRAITVALALTLAGPAWAETTPDPGRFDSRVRNVVYNPAQVYQLNVKYGRTLLIQFAPNESVEKGVVAMGDPGGWVVGPKGNNLLVKPTAKQADTNMTVITTRRTYLFDLNATSGSGPKMYAVRFKYPALKRQRQAAQHEQQRLEAKLNQKYTATNWNYWAKGATAIEPTRVWDNGQFTYMRFPPTMSMPAVYTETANGEALVNTHVKGNILVVHAVAKKLVLRKGQLVTALINRGYDVAPILYNTHNTTIPGVERTIKR